ncbi:MAG: HEAT repeat domain-containing protein [Nitrospirota bacterium]
MWGITAMLAVFFPAEHAMSATSDDLIVRLKSKDTLEQASAVEALGRVKDQKAVDALLDFVFTKAENWKIKIRAIRLLGTIPDQKVSDKLVTVFNNPFLNEECPAMKWNTAIALGQEFNKGSRAVDSLIEALGLDNLLVREAAIQSLGKIGDSRAVPYLIPELRDKNFAIRFSAIKALGNIGNSEAEVFLRQVADTDNDPYVQQAAEAALDKIRAYQ